MHEAVRVRRVAVEVYQGRGGYPEPQLLLVLLLLRRGP
jgi:hypothetical protein